jgi:hypothetical protein
VLLAYSLTLNKAISLSTDFIKRLVMKNFQLAVVCAFFFTTDTFSQTVALNQELIQQKFSVVDGHRMHYQVAGNGSPTVVFESGVTDDAQSWSPVFTEVARFTRTVSYDRLGLGSSDTATTPRSFKQIATDLHSLLHNAQISPPYILVGHSMAGPTIRAFAYLYKEEIAGMVFIDCMTEYDIYSVNCQMCLCTFLLVKKRASRKL